MNKEDNINIDSLEIKALPDSKYFIKKYKMNDIPESICLGAIVRNGRVIIPNNPNINLEPNDNLLIFLKPESITKAENLFQ